MRIKKILISFLFVFFAFTINVTNVYANKDESVYLGGFPAGFCMYTRGATVIGICDVVGVNEITSPAKNAGIETGDVILSIDGNEVNNVSDIEKAINGKSTIIAEVLRDKDIILKDVTLAKDNNGKRRLGLFIREGINGIGTITFIKNGKIASLGHPVLDENQFPIEIVGGKLYDCSISGCIKGEKGKPGELKGLILRKNNIATINSNTNYGVYGDVENIDYSKLCKVELGKAEIGDAKIISTIDSDKPTEFDISIIKNNNPYDKDSKNLIIKITDKRLLQKTGGIVQGMSGSPIIQNGKLVGAVTHVFINDPTRGYGINISNMINHL